MGLRKGQTNNPAGKPKGAKNKVSQDIREKIATLIEGNLNDFEKDLSKLEPKERIKFLIDLMPYVVPKLQTISNTIDFDSLTDEQLDEIINRLKEGQ